MTAGILTETKLPAAVKGTRADLSPEARAKIRKLMGARPLPFLVQLVVAWSVIIGAIIAAETVDNIWATALAILVIATRQNVFALLVHEQAHHLGFARKWGDLFVNLTAAYPLIFITVQDYAQVHLLHHKFFFKDKDPDRHRKSGDEWSFPMKKRKLFRLFLNDILGANFVKLYKGKKLKKDRPAPFKRKMAIPKWAGSAFLLGALTVFILTGTWDIFLIYWMLPLLTVFQIIIRWGALCEHKYNLPGAALEDSTPIIRLSWWEKLLLPNLNFHFHLYHHYYSNVSWSNLPRLHEIFREDGLVNDNNIFNGYGAYFRALTTVNEVKVKKELILPAA